MITRSHIGFMNLAAIGITRMAEQGKRFNEGKRRWSLIDHRVLESLVDVMAIGEKKYGPKNYQLGMPIVEIMDSLQRHLVEFRDHKIDHDKETKIHHAAHILSNAYILMYNVLFHPEMDNRVKEESKFATDQEVIDYVNENIKENAGGILQNAKVGSKYPKTVPSSSGDCKTICEQQDGSYWDPSKGYS